jgi:AbiV family abortive infection protein
MPRPEVPPPDRAWEGLRLALENSHRHLICAEALAGIGQCSVATSHLVLAAEETVKGAVFWAIAMEAPVPEREVRNLLSNHTIRHELADQMILMNLVFGGFIEALMPFHPSNFTSDTEFRKARMAAAKRHFEALAERFTSNAPDDVLLRGREWWPVAPQLKNQGFYVDYAAGRWASPNDLTVAQYELAHQIVVDLLGPMRNGLEWWLSLPAAELQELAPTMAEWCAEYPV